MYPAKATCCGFRLDLAMADQYSAGHQQQEKHVAKCVLAQTSKPLSGAEAQRAMCHRRPDGLPVDFAVDFPNPDIRPGGLSPRAVF